MPAFYIPNVRTVIITATLAMCWSCGNTIKITRAERKHQDSLRAYPYWIAMMDQDRVNYFKAVEAFNLYWENREKPTEPDGEGRNLYSEDRDQKRDKPVQYVYEYKRFLNWQLRNKDLVKPDSTIMTQEELMEQWKKSKNERSH